MAGEDVMVQIGGTAVPLQQVLASASAAVGDFAAKTQSSGKSAASGVEEIGSKGAQLPSIFQNIGNAIKGEFDQIKDRAGMVLETMLLWRSLDTVIFGLTSQIQSMGDAMFNLNVETERAQTNWTYLFGGGNTAQGRATSQGLMDWTKTASMSIPYTRQDLMAAITTLGSQGMTTQQAEQFIPTLADIASTQGRPGLTLQWAARSVVEAQMGLSRMLKYDLNINPTALEKFGFNEKSQDKGNLLQALQKYAASRGESGAAKDISTETWWGAWSSFIDRVQNWEMSAGQSAFQVLKKDLTDVSDWMDAHSEQLNKLAQVIGTDLANAAHFAAQEIQQFIKGLHGGEGLDPLESIGNAIHQIAVAFSDPNIQNGISILAHFAGTLAVGSIDLFAKAIGETAKAIKAIADDGPALEVVKLTMLALVGVFTFQTVTAAWSFASALDAAAIGAMVLEAPVWVVVLAIGALSLAVVELISHWDQVTTAIGNFIQKIAPQFSQMAVNAAHWGADLIKNFIQGMLDQFGNMWGFVQSNILDKIWKNFGHSEPQEGPLAGDSQWGGHFLQNWIDSMNARVPALINSMNAITGTVNGSMTGGYGGVSAGGSYSSVAYGSSYSNSTGDFNFYGMTDAQIERVVDRYYQQKSQGGNSTMRSAGTAIMRPGGVAF